MKIACGVGKKGVRIAYKIFSLLPFLMLCLLDLLDLSIFSVMSGAVEKNLGFGPISPGL